MRPLKTIYILLLLCLFPLIGMAQESQKPAIRMRAEVQTNRILLRWIPTDAESWELLNRYGVRLERLTVARSGKVLDNPETKVLAEVMKPEETDELKQLVAANPMGGVIAQAIFGEDFEVGIGDHPLSKAISLDEMRQQRYLFSLYAADLCFPVAKEVGWGWIDNDIKENERYLYRVTSLVPKKKREISQGAVFAIANEKINLVRPIGLTAQFSESGALLTWDYNTLSYLYSAYVIERSLDGKNFEQVSDLPVTRMADTDKNPHAPITYLDSIPLGKTIYYRVAGVTPFGSKGVYSDVVSGTAYPALKAPPLITSYTFDQNGGADIAWNFDDEEQALISGFNVFSSRNDRTYGILAANVSSQARHFHIDRIGRDIYYKVEAQARQGASTQSPPILLQPIDSVPPAIPQGLKAQIDSLGRVHLSWDENQDADLYGYRLYRGQTKGEELIPITDVAIRNTYFTDSVNINNLNNKVYYALTSLDERYNQSAPSEVIEVTKPLTIPPSAPLITKGLAEDGKNIIEWVVGENQSIIGFIVSRTDAGGKSEQKVLRIEDPAAYRYEDTDIESGRSYTYQIMAYTGNQLRSLLSNPIKIKSFISKAEEGGMKFDLEALPEGIAVRWNIPDENLISVTLYKSDSMSTKFLYREGLPSSGELVDKEVSPEGENEYTLIVKLKGRKPSQLIKKIRL